MNNNKILITAFRFSDSGEPHLTKKLTWRSQDVKTNVLNIHSLLSTEDEVILISEEDYNTVTDDNTITDFAERHCLLRSYGVVVYKGCNA